MLTTFPKWLRKPSNLLAGLQPASASEVRCFLALSAIVVITAIGLRFSGVSMWPSDFHLTRQYHGANVARRIWLQMSEVAPGTAEHAWLQGQTRPIIEPPIIETVTAVGYLMAGGEVPWLGSAINAVLWLLGGAFVYDTARRLSGGIFGGLAATAFYLLSPFGIVVSRSFQPEALVVCGFTIAVWQAVRMPAHRSFGNAAAFGVIAGVVVLLKPGVPLFPLVCLLAVPAAMEIGWKRTLTSSRIWAAGLLTVLPAMIYMLIFLTAQLNSKFLPQLLTTSEFYSAWLVQVERTIGWLPLLAAIAGACLLQRKENQWVGISLFLGYVVYSLFFSWHTMTHNYYQALLVPIVAICLGPLAEIFRDGMKNLRVSRAFAIAGPVLLVLVVLRFGLPARKFTGQATHQVVAEQVYEEIKQQVGGGHSVICLSAEYGLPLMYHSWLVTHWWPTSTDLDYEVRRGIDGTSPEVRLAKMLQEHRPSHFVITNMRELERQPELQKLLRDHYRVASQGKRWVIYHLDIAPSRQSTTRIEPSQPGPTS